MESRELNQSLPRDYPQRYKQLAAIRYYLHFVLWEVGNYWRSTHRGVTNYNTLLDDLERWRLRASEKVCLVTFNYDKILESALPVLGIDIRDLAGYITNDNYKSSRFMVLLIGAMKSKLASIW